MQQLDGQTRIKSVAVGTQLLRVLAEARRPVALKGLAAACEMSASKAHRYLASFLEVGMVVQDKATRQYSLGPLAVQIGLSALGAYQPLQAAIAVQRQWRQCFDETFVLSVWSPRGPVVVHVDESSHPIIMTMRVGAILPLLTTATGMVFLAHLPSYLTAQLVDDTLCTDSRREHFAHSRSELEELLTQVRTDGHAYNMGHLTPGISALAVPITDHFGSLAAVGAVMGHDADINPTSAPLLAETMSGTAQVGGRLRPLAHPGPDTSQRGARKVGTSSPRTDGVRSSAARAAGH